MRLYNAGLSPNALRVRAVAAELGLDLEIVGVDLRDPEAKARDLGPLNPNRKVPVLVDGDFVLWESRAINGYLASLKPEAGLHPADSTPPTPASAPSSTSGATGAPSTSSRRCAK